jgi:hypothetical protein
MATCSQQTWAQRLNAVDLDRVDQPVRLYFVSSMVPQSKVGHLRLGTTVAVMQHKRCSWG